MKVPMTQEQITGHQKMQCVGILSHLSKQNELPQQEILLLASCSKHCHHFSFFFFWGSGRGTVCVAHYRNSCISLCKVRSRTCSHGWLGTDRLSNMQLTSCVEKHIMQGWKGKKKAQLITLTQQEVSVQCRSLWYLSCSGEKRAVRS